MSRGQNLSNKTKTDSKSFKEYVYIVIYRDYFRVPILYIYSRVSYRSQYVICSHNGSSVDLFTLQWRLAGSKCFRLHVKAWPCNIRQELGDVGGTAVPASTQLLDI